MNQSINKLIKEYNKAISQKLKLEFNNLQNNHNNKNLKMKMYHQKNNH